MRRRRLLALAAVLAAVTAFTGLVSARRIGRQMAIDRACTAVAEGRFDEAVALSSDLVGADADGRLAAECRCRALVATGREAECAASLDEILGSGEAAGWLPAPDLAARVVRHRQAAGDLAGAADLARRAAIASPEDAALHQLEVVTRGALEGEPAVLEALERRVAAADGPALGARLALALSYTRQGDHARVAAALGDVPPPRGHPYTAFWFQARAWALAGLGDLAGLRATYDAWRAHGGDPAAIEADYALQLSIAQLRDPEHSWVELIERALEHEDELTDPKVVAALYARWIGHLLVAGEFDEALKLYDRASERYELVGITREQIVQGGVVAELGSDAAAAKGTLAFRLAPGTPAGTLLVSPDVTAEPDVAFERHALAPGAVVRVARGTAVTPQRWVLRGAGGDVAASGGVWPAPGREVGVEIHASEGRGAVPPRGFARAAPPGDGRRRVFVVVPDCGDWRLVQYLRARGELPVMDALLAAGHRAVLTSDPPLTAAAMEKLVWPERGRDVSFLGELNRLGLELAGLASVERVAAEGRSLFETVGQGPHVAANLLFAHGGIDAGRNARLHGPDGAEREGPRLEAWRELTPAESAEWPDAASDRAHDHARTIAAEMDAALALARGGEVDLLLLRIEPLDLLTHELFGELTRTRQDDGRSGLLDAYRYLDRRIGELWNALDADDVLVVLSDHGIRTAMEHADDAIFVAVGPGIAPGRAPGRPEIAGVPRALASLFGVETVWPETGVADSWEPATRGIESAKAADGGPSKP